MKVETDSSGRMFATAETVKDIEALLGFAKKAELGAKLSDARTGKKYGPHPIKRCVLCAYRGKQLRAHMKREHSNSKVSTIQINRAPVEA